MFSCSSLASWLGARKPHADDCCHRQARTKELRYCTPVEEKGC